MLNDLEEPLSVETEPGSSSYSSRNTSSGAAVGFPRRLGVYSALCFLSAPTEKTDWREQGPVESKDKETKCLEVAEHFCWIIVKHIWRVEAESGEELQYFYLMYFLC